MAARLFAAAKEKLLRQSLRPVTLSVPAAQATSTLLSKFGGTRPFLKTDEVWPKCGDCSNPLRFFFQLDIEKLPQDGPQRRIFGDSGLLQLFVCIDNECYNHFEPFSTQSLVRIIQPPLSENEADTKKSLLGLSVDFVENAFPEKLIVGWQRERDELPNAEELLRFHDNLYSPDPSPDLGELSETLHQHNLFPLSQVKVGGWPYWVQGVEYPSCPTCKGSMSNMIIQLEDGEEVPFAWGDSGIAHVTQCPNHPEQVAFAWACC